MTNTITAIGKIGTTNWSAVLSFTTGLLSILLAIIAIYEFTKRQPKLKIYLRAFMIIWRIPLSRRREPLKVDLNNYIYVNFIVTNITSTSNSLLSIKYKTDNENFTLERATQFILDSYQPSSNKYVFTSINSEGAIADSFGCDGKEIFQAGTSIKAGDSLIVSDVIQCKAKDLAHFVGKMPTLLEDKILIEITDAYGKIHVLKNVPKDGICFSNLMK